MSKKYLIPSPPKKSAKAMKAKSPPKPTGQKFLVSKQIFGKNSKC